MSNGRNFLQYLSMPKDHNTFLKFLGCVFSSLEHYQCTPLNILCFQQPLLVHHRYQELVSLPGSS